MQKRLIVLFILILSWFITLPARAELYMELTQGINQAIPLTIQPFTGVAATVSGGQALTEVISNDLQNSGQFQLSSQRNDYLLTGQIMQTTADQYAVTVELKSAFTAANGESPVFFKKVFDVRAADLRQLAHTISDLVYEQLTGVRGIFNTKIAYVVRHWPANSAPVYALQVADADGFNPQTLLISPQPIMSPSWSPDGANLAYVSFEGHRSGIFLQNLHTGQRQLVSRFDGINGAPVFSPDGSQLALVLTQKTGHPKIYTMNLNNRQLTQITDGYSIDTEPRWAPDGRSMLFTSDRGGTPQIYRYDFTNGKVIRLTYQGNYNARASFLPDGQSIIMMHRQNDSFGIAKLNLASNQMQILTESGLDESPSLAPNGKMVLYATQYQGRGALAVVSIDGRIKLRLPTQGGAVQEPAWSPFF